MTHRAALAISCLVTVSSCSGIQSPLAPAGDQAAWLHWLLVLMFWVCGIVYLVVLGFLGTSIWRRRHQFATSPDLNPDDRHLDSGLIAWSGAIVLGLTILVVGSFVVERNLAAARATETLRIRVTAQQWWWRIEYRNPSGAGWIETANELHLPADRTARLELGSTDVIHSIWVPNVAGKMDVIPGRANAIDVTPRRLGWYRGQCAEFCGAQHAHMALDVKVETPAAFAAWLARQAAPATAPADPIMLRGSTVVTQGQCAACHTVRGTAARGRAGPDLTHVGDRRSIASGTLAMSRGALQGWIAQPQALKPGTLMPAVSLSGADADAVSRYLESRK
jgi:cytochrome c oxidase subunit 2